MHDQKGALGETYSEEFYCQAQPMELRVLELRQASLYIDICTVVSRTLGMLTRHGLCMTKRRDGLGRWVRIVELNQQSKKS